MLRICLSVLALVAAAATVSAKDEARKPPPDHLTFGYEGEGKVDATPAACLATAHEVVAWTEEETKKAADKICAARRRHVDAYAAIQKAIRRC